MSYETSRREGREQSYEKLGARCIAILGVLRQAPEGMAAYEINRRLVEDGVLHTTDLNSVKPRLTELKAGGIIEGCGRRKTPSGCATTVWRMKERRE